MRSQLGKGETEGTCKGPEAKGSITLEQSACSSISLEVAVE